MARVVGAGLVAARLLVPTFIAHEVGVTQALREFRELGFALRTQTFTDLFRESRQIAATRGIFELLDPEEPIRPELFTRVERFIPTRFVYITTIEFQDPITGELKEFRHSTFDDTRLSVAEIKRRAIRDFLNIQEVKVEYGEAFPSIEQLRISSATERR